MCKYGTIVTRNIKTIILNRKDRPSTGTSTFILVITNCSKLNHAMNKTI